MRVLEFNIAKGYYSFELGDLETGMHTHPALEVIVAINGSFGLQTAETIHEDLSMAIIDDNTCHALHAGNAKVKLLMIERVDAQVYDFFEQCGIRLTQGVFTCKNIEKERYSWEAIINYLSNTSFKPNYDLRVMKCLALLDSGDLAYHSMLSILQDHVHLSESRLSHLFKENIGVSIKKYLVWSRLKLAIDAVLYHGDSLSSAAHRSGFFDQAHLSKAFKEMLGIHPSAAYNSRTLQG